MEYDSVALKGNSNKRKLLVHGRTGIAKVSPSGKYIAYKKRRRLYYVFIENSLEPEVMEKGYINSSSFFWVMENNPPPPKKKSRQ